MLALVSKSAVFYLIYHSIGSSSFEKKSALGTLAARYLRRAVTVAQNAQIIKAKLQREFDAGFALGTRRRRCLRRGVTNAEDAQIIEAI